MLGKKPTIGEISEGKENIVVNYSKLQKAIKRCKEEKDIKQCKLEFERMGIKFYDD